MPRQIYQQQQLFGDTCPRVTPTNPSAGPRLDHLMKIQPTQTWLADIVGETTDTHRPYADAPMPGEVPPLASDEDKEAFMPRQVP